MKLVRLDKKDDKWILSFFDGKLDVFPYPFTYDDKDIPRIWVDETKIPVHEVRLIRGSTGQVYGIPT